MIITNRVAIQQFRQIDYNSEVQLFSYFKMKIITTDFRGLPAVRPCLQVRSHYAAGFEINF